MANLFLLSRKTFDRSFRIVISRTGFGYVAKIGEVILTGGKGKKRHKSNVGNFFRSVTSL